MRDDFFRVSFEIMDRSLYVFFDQGSLGGPFLQVLGELLPLAPAFAPRARYFARTYPWQNARHRARISLNSSWTSHPTFNTNSRACRVTLPARPYPRARQAHRLEPPEKVVRQHPDPEKHRVRQTIAAGHSRPQRAPEHLPIHLQKARQARAHAAQPPANRDRAGRSLDPEHLQEPRVRADDPRVLRVLTPLMIRPGLATEQILPCQRGFSIPESNQSRILGQPMTRRPPLAPHSARDPPRRTAPWNRGTGKSPA